MSSRIEHADPLATMRELPDRWAQTCITSPPAGDPARTLAVLTEVHRVLREDGTLWLLRPPSSSLFTALLEDGWLRQPPPAWASPLACEAPLRPVLLTKSDRYFLRPRLASATRTHAPTRSGAGERTQHCRHCPTRLSGVVERCILGCSSMLACGACGAPRPTLRKRERAGNRTGCAHLDGRGRCLVLDPFYEPRTGAAELASRHGRSFLAMTTAGERP